MATPAQAIPSASGNQPTLAQLIRSKYPNEYADMDDATLETKVLAKYPQYADLPRTPVQGLPQREIGAAPTGVLPWLRNLEGDIRYGTQTTAPGRLLSFLGAKGTNVGAQSQAADIMASPVLGPTRMAQGAAEMPTLPWQATKDIVGGALQTAQLPAAFVAPPAARAAPEAAQATGAALYKNLPFVGKAFASKARAATNFQQVMGAAEKEVVPVTNELSDALSRYQQLADRGGSRSIAVTKLMNRLTTPESAPLTYKEARDFYNNISRLSADEFNRLTPVMKQQVGAVRVALNNAIQGTAETVGKGEQYANAMQEFAQGARNTRKVAALGKVAKKLAFAGALGAASAGTAAGIYDALRNK